jgi:hypothetical protein
MDADAKRLVRSVRSVLSVPYRTRGRRNHTETAPAGHVVFAVLCSGTTLEKLRPVDSKLKYQVSPSRASHVRLLECAKGLADRTMHACGLGL